MKRHKEALEIIVLTLNSKSLAEEYAVKHYRHNDELSRCVFQELLSIYIEQKPELVVEFLNVFGNFVDLADSIDYLDDDIFLKSISSFLRTSYSLQSCNSFNQTVQLKLLGLQRARVKLFNSERAGKTAKRIIPN